MNDLINKIKALGDKNRFRICSLLEQKPLCVCELLSVIDIAGGTLSNHLKILKNCGLIDQTKSGKWIIYSIKDNDAKELVQYLATKINDREELDKDLNNLKMSNREQCITVLPKR